MYSWYTPNNSSIRITCKVTIIASGFSWGSCLYWKSIICSNPIIKSTAFYLKSQSRLFVFVIDARVAILLYYVTLYYIVFYIYYSYFLYFCTKWNVGIPFHFMLAITLNHQMNFCLQSCTSQRPCHLIIIMKRQRGATWDSSSAVYRKKADLNSNLIV